MAVYQAFYGFRAAPFSVNPDPRFLFLSRRHREALAGLLYGIRDGKGFAVLTGEVGTGKTTLIHAMLTELGNRVHTALVFNPSLSRNELYPHLLAEFGLPQQPSILSCVRSLQQFLLGRFEAGAQVVVVLDEAHALSGEILEEVRLLSNFETSQNKLLQILLVGQPELKLLLGTEALRALRQRVALRFELTPFDFGEMVAYVRSRLVRAGGNARLFTPSAHAALYRFSGGVPRLINILCDASLLTGFARDQSEIGTRLVRQAARDLDLPPVARVGLYHRLFGQRQERAEVTLSEITGGLDFRPLEAGK